MRRVWRALLAVIVAWLVTWVGMAVALGAFTGSASQSPELWYVGVPTVVLLGAAMLPPSAETTLASAVAVLAMLLVLALLLDGSGYVLAAALSLGVPVWLAIGAVVGMTAAQGRRALRWRWLTTRRIDAWLHHRNES